MTAADNRDGSAMPAREPDEFVRLFTSCQKKIYWYIFSLLHDVHDAEEVFQETAIVLWQKFASFQSGTNFVAWACRIAYHKVLRFRDEHRRDIPCLSNVFLEEVAPELLAVIDMDAANLLDEQLAECLAKLNQRDRELVYLRYKPGATTKRVAAEVGRSTDAVYKALNRIHQALFECMRGHLLEGGQPS